MKEYEKGQVLLIVVLVMIVTLTIGLSVVTRTITNNRITTEEQNSEQAFSAAEAGLEKSLATNVATTGNFATNNSSYTTVIRNVSGADILLNNGTPVLKDNPIDVWLAQYPTYATPWSGNVTVYWGSSSENCASSEASNTRAALEVVIIRGSLAAPQVTHYGLDPCAARASSNRFESIPQAGGTIGGKTFSYSKTITIAPASPGLLMRIIPLYASSTIAVRGSTALPSQGTIIESVGTVDKTKRKIISFRGYPSLPTELFPFILFSPK